MIKALLFLSLLFTLSSGVFAEDINFGALSKQLLENEMLQSPVYTKMLYRQIYENDTAAYNRQMQYLETLKKQGKLSGRDYLARVEELKKAYAQAHPQSLAEQGIKITQAPVDMLLDATFTNRRHPLMLATHTPKVPTKNNQVNAVIPADSDRQNIPTTVSENMAVIKLNKTQKLGQKVLRINLDAFK